MSQPIEVNEWRELGPSDAMAPGNHHRKQVAHHLWGAFAVLAVLALAAGIALTVATSGPPERLRQVALAAGRLESPQLCRSAWPQNRGAMGGCELVQRRHPDLPDIQHVVFFNRVGADSLRTTMLAEATDSHAGTFDVKARFSPADPAARADRDQAKFFDVDLSRGVLYSVNGADPSIILSTTHVLPRNSEVIINSVVESQGGALRISLSRTVRPNEGAESSAPFDRVNVMILHPENPFGITPGDLVDVNVPYDEWTTANAVKARSDARSLPKQSIWLGVATALAVLLAAYAAIHWLMRLVAIQAENSEAEVSARLEDMEVVIDATHHDLNRNISLIGFASDDLTENGANTADLDEAFAGLEDSRDLVAALASLGSQASLTISQGLIASDLTPSQDSFIETRDVGAIAADRSMLRIAVRTLTNQAEMLDRATRIIVTTTADGVLRVEYQLRTPPGKARDPQDLKQRGPMIHRIISAHSATLVVQGSEDNYRTYEIRGFQVSEKLGRAVDIRRIAEIRASQGEIRVFS